MERNEIETEIYKVLEHKTEEQCEHNKEGFKSTLESYESYCQRKKHEIEALGKEFIEETTQAFLLILQEFSKSGDKQAVEEMGRGAESFKAYFADHKNQTLPADKTVAAIMNYSGQLLDKIYHLAVVHYRKGDLLPAKKIVALLLMLDPGYSACWIAFGMIQKDEKKWQESLDSFTMASKIDPENPLPLLHSAGCHKELGHTDEARLALDRALELATHRPEYNNYIAIINNEKNKMG
jgi:tetratricopeptide (TPR) repeat protein